MLTNTGIARKIAFSAVLFGGSHLVGARPVDAMSFFTCFSTTGEGTQSVSLGNCGYFFGDPCSEVASQCQSYCFVYNQTLGQLVDCQAVPNWVSSATCWCS